MVIEWVLIATTLACLAYGVYWRARCADMCELVYRAEIAVEINGKRSVVKNAEKECEILIRELDDEV